jgi:hypothetical protein
LRVAIVTMGLGLVAGFVETASEAGVGMDDAGGAVEIVLGVASTYLATLLLIEYVAMARWE